MTTHKNLMTLCVAAVFAVGLAACGGNGNGDGPAAVDETPPPPPTLDLSDLTDDQEIDAGEYTVAGLPADTPEGVAIPIPADGVAIGDATFSCSGDEACTVMVDGTTLTTTGTITVAIADTAPVDPPVDPGPTDPAPTPVAVTLPDVTANYGDNVEELSVPMGTYDISAGDTMTVGDVNFACAMGGDDCSVEVMADGSVMSTGGDVSASVTLAYLETQLAAVNERNEQLEADKALEERIARADSILTAITAAAKALPTTNTGITAVTAERDADGMLTIDLNGATDDEYSGGEVTAGGDPWNSATLTNTRTDDSQDVVVIYTDIEAPSDKLFTDQYMQAQLDNALAAATVEKAQSSGFPSDPGTTWTYTGEEDERAKTVIGTFDGVDGQFTCTAATCSVETTSEGELMESDGWRFTPASPLDATVKDPDTAYTYFGWWLNKPEDATDTHDVDVFVDGSTDAGALASGGVDPILGNATYMGPAAGKYATRTFTAGVQTDAAAGHFTANAELTARFMDENAPGMIGGKITNFMLDDEYPMSSWEVILEDAEVSESFNNGRTEVDFGGGATDTDDAAPDDHPGSWGGAFYGADTTDTSNAPSTFVGTFDAEVDNAAVLGAFGTSLQE